MDEASDHYRAAIDIWRELREENPAAVQYRFMEAHCYTALGLLAENTGRPAEAFDPYLTAIQAFAELADKHPDVPKGQRSLTNAHSNLGIAYVRAGDQGHPSIP